MHFVKSHGLGNDYIVVDPEALPFELTSRAVMLICHRNYGVGSDGILARRVPSKPIADFAMTIHNPDGSEAEKSGNGIRIFAKYLFDHGMTSQERFTIETPGGVVGVQLQIENGVVVSVAADMGQATFDRELTSIEVDGATVGVVSLSLGNPHCVVFSTDVDAVPVSKIGPLIEVHRAFPSGTNVQFVEVVSRDFVLARIWERGAGETLSSGSSSCAVAAACLALGYTDRSLTVSMDGGDLEIEIDEDGEIRMDGPVAEICSGDFSSDLVARLAQLQ
ncbi:MAG: diaminopimelate epimerase [Dehalococcoidia bacterium]